MKVYRWMLMVNSDYDGKGEILSSGIVYAGNWTTAKSLASRATDSTNKPWGRWRKVGDHFEKYDGDRRNNYPYSKGFPKHKIAVIREE